MADEEPAGLYMSLDDLITENKEKPRAFSGRSRGGGAKKFDGGASRRQQYHAQRGTQAGQGRSTAAPGAVMCYACGQPGHMSRECPNSGAGAVRAGGGNQGPCFNCGLMGHTKAHCPRPAAGPRTVTVGGAGGMPGMSMGMGRPGGMAAGFGGGMAGPGMMGGAGMGMGMGGGMGGLSLEELQMQRMMMMQEMALMEQQMALQSQLQQVGGGIGRPGRRVPAAQQQAAVQQQQSEGALPKDDAYRKDQKCFLDEHTGDVVVQLKGMVLVRVAPNGDIGLDTGGWYTPPVLASMNDALNGLGIRITAAGDVADGDWSITDGRALMRFRDGVIIPSKGPQHVTRGQTVLQSFQHPKRAAAAKATAASTAAAAQAGIFPGAGLQRRGVDGGRGHGRRGRGGGGVFNRLGGRVGGEQNGAGSMQIDDDEEAGRVRRLRAQGRFNPY